jgi:hypothetical protein
MFNQRAPRCRPLFWCNGIFQIEDDHVGAFSGFLVALWLVAGAE